MLASSTRPTLTLSGGFFARSENFGMRWFDGENRGFVRQRNQYVGKSFIEGDNIIPFSWRLRSSIPYAGRTIASDCDIQMREGGFTRERNFWNLNKGSFGIEHTAANWDEKAPCNNYFCDFTFRQFIPPSTADFVSFDQVYNFWEPAFKPATRAISFFQCTP